MTIDEFDVADCCHKLAAAHSGTESGNSEVRTISPQGRRIATGPSNRQPLFSKTN